MRFLITGLGSIGQRQLRNLITHADRDIILYRTDTSLRESRIVSKIEFALPAIIADREKSQNYKSRHTGGISTLCRKS